MNRPILALLVALATLLAGCAGSSPEPLAPDPNGNGEAPETPPEEPPRRAEDATGCESDDPKFHTHDYWGLRDAYVLFDGPLQIGQRPQEETIVRQDQVVVGYREFNTLDDGDDAGATDKTDVVYQGTRYILVKLTWSAGTIPGLKFFFQHASTPEYVELGPVVSGQEYTIELRPRWADMAHTDFVSRWNFKIEAYDPAQSASPFKLHTAQGAVNVFMEIQRGDATYLDPPHPAFFCAGPVRYAGEINGSVGQAVVVTAKQGPVEEQLHYGASLDGFHPDPPHIVPVETRILRAWLHYNYTGPLNTGGSHALGLKYHAANTLTYSHPEPKEARAGFAYYEIEVDGRMVDSPYAFTTDWRYGVYPIVNGQREQGDFQGNFHIVLEAVKI